MFTAVKYLKDFPNGNNSPAMVNRKTGELYINLYRWNNIAFEHRVFIILHELAHVKLNSSDEKLVDELAHKWFIEMGYSLTDSVYALTKVLHADSKINYERSLDQFKRAYAIEKAYNQYSAYVGFDDLKNNPNIIIASVYDGYDDSILVEFEQYDFDIANELKQLKGLSRKDYKKMKKSVRLYKRMGRAKKKNAVANDVQAGADTRQTYAEQGVYVPTRAEAIGKGFADTTKAIAGAFGGGLGGVAQTVTDYATEATEPNYSSRIAPSTDNSTTANTTTTKKKKSNTTVYVTAGVIGVAILAIIIYVIKK